MDRFVDIVSVDTASGDTSVDKFRDGKDGVDGELGPFGMDAASVDTRDSVDKEFNFTALQTFCPVRDGPVRAGGHQHGPVRA